MPRAWLTPEDAPGTLVCVKVYIPSGEEYQSALRGALLLLGEPENWEQHGAQSPDTIAGAFFDAFLLTVPIEAC